jgi:putative tryptophan/tyrosine transport system substrate-binding protein
LPAMPPSHHPGIPPDDSRQRANIIHFMDYSKAPMRFRRDLIVALAARHRLPAAYHASFFVLAGGLMSYGIDRVDTFRRTTSYVDRILRGANPADLPVQAPTRYETVLNLKTAKALGLTVPPGLLVAADEVIE